MVTKDHIQICDEIIGFSPYIRFVGIIGESGELFAYKRRQDLVPLLNEKKYSFSILTYCYENRFGRIF